MTIGKTIVIPHIPDWMEQTCGVGLASRRDLCHQQDCIHFAGGLVYCTLPIQRFSHEQYSRSTRYRENTVMVRSSLLCTCTPQAGGQAVLPSDINLRRIYFTWIQIGNWRTIPYSRISMSLLVINLAKCSNIYVFQIVNILKFWSNITPYLHVR